MRVDAVQRQRRDDRPIAATDRAVAAAGIDGSVGLLEFEHYVAAVTLEAVLQAGGGVAHCLDRH